MDRRFVRTWNWVDARRQTGEPFDRVLAGLSLPDLVEALAGAGDEDPVAANAIATQLLNRIRRAATAFLVAVLLLAVGIATMLIDGFLTGEWGRLDVATFDLLLGITAGVLALGFLASGAAVLRLRRGGANGR